MDALANALPYAFLLAVCFILVALVATVLCERNLLGQGGKDLGRTLLPFLFALLVWPFFQWPSSHIWDQGMLASVFVFVLLGLGRVGKLIVRTVHSRQR